MTANDPFVPPMATPAGPPPEVAVTFRDSSIHDFDLARFLTGQEVAEVSVTAGRRDGMPAADLREIERAVTVMWLSGGTLAVLQSSWLNPSGYDARVEVLTEQTVLSAGLSPRTPLRHLDWPDALGEPWSHYLERFTDAYRAELTAFLAAARGERPPSTTARDGLEAMRVAAAATRPHVEQRRVGLDEVEGLARVEVAGCGTRCWVRAASVPCTPRSSPGCSTPVSSRWRTAWRRGRRRWPTGSAHGRMRWVSPSQGPMRSSSPPAAPPTRSSSGPGSSA